MGIFTKPVAPQSETQEALISRTMAAITKRNDMLAIQKSNALSAFRSTANQLKAVNTGLTEIAKASEEMVVFFSENKTTTEQEIKDNEAVIDRILAIIGE